MILPDSPSFAPALTALRDMRAEGNIASLSEACPGLALHSDAGLTISGHWQSPAGRLLELDVAIDGHGDWLGLHVALGLDDLTALDWVGLTCRVAAPAEIMIRPCLRSGQTDGFTDSFFPRHILAVAEPRNHVDTLHIPTSRAIPETAPWRELVLFLPRESFSLHLQDLKIFAV